jgi:hypothetical protein
VANETRPHGPLDDPRLVDRRGDLSGFSALLFLGLVLVGFALVALVLYLVTTPTAGPTASPTPTAAATPGLTAPPSLTPTAPPSPPTPTSLPAGSPGPGASLPVVVVATGKPAALVVDGAEVGSVTVLRSGFTRDIAGDQAPQGQRYLVASIRYRAAAPMIYDAARWRAVDRDGTSYEWRGSGDPRPALRTGTLAAGENVTGNVTFVVPRGVPIRSLVLTGDDGRDLVRVSLQ